MFVEIEQNVFLVITIETKKMKKVTKFRLRCCILLIGRKLNSVHWFCLEMDKCFVDILFIFFITNAIKKNI